MNRFSQNITNLQDYSLQQTQLGQMCGSQRLFCDRYQILRVLGRGGFGITYLCKDIHLPEHPLCVIKQLYQRDTNAKSWQKSCQRFEKEAKILGQLGSHAQIPMLLDYFTRNGEFYLVQEYIQGYTLAREVRRTGIKNEVAVKQFLQQILPVLHYLQQNHVIHRDIKPQNLLRCEQHHRIVLIDFGAVKEQLVNARNSSHKGVTTNFVGTMGFAPPEQYSLRPVYASDIYALGVTCLYLLTGKGPLDFHHDLRTGEILWQEEVNISDNLAKVLGKMVKISICERFRTANEVMRAMGMESSLTSCLMNQPPSRKSVIPSEDVYISPIAQRAITSSGRTAIAIREWKARMKQKKLSH